MVEPLLGGATAWWNQPSFGLVDPKQWPDVQAQRAQVCAARGCVGSREGVSKLRGVSKLTRWSAGRESLPAEAALTEA